jgi:BlaI family penicillinase repressor
MTNPYSKFGRREREIMEVLFRRGRATVTEVKDDIPDPPSYSSVRSMLRLLEEKGHVRHEWDGPRHVYLPTVDAGKLQQSAARHLLTTFFNSSMEAAVAAMLGASEKPASKEELKRLAELVERARRKGGRP